MHIFDKSKTGRLVLASMMAFGVATMFNVSVSDAAQQVKPIVVGGSLIIYRTTQNSEGWVVLDRWNNNQPDTTYYHIHGVPGDDDYSLVLSYNGTSANFAIPAAFEKEQGISLVKDGDNLYIEYKDPTDKKKLQAPKRLWLGKFFKYDRRQGGQQPRGYFVSANNLEDSDFKAAGLISVVYYDGTLGEYLHKDTIEPDKKSLKKTQAEKVSDEMAGTSAGKSGSGTEVGYSVSHSTGVSNSADKSGSGTEVGSNHSVTHSTGVSNGKAGTH